MNRRTLVRALLAAGAAAAVFGQGGNRVALITLTQRGFEPARVQVRPGKVVLIIKSHLPGSAEYEIAEAGSRPSRMLGRRLHSKRFEELTLTPGTYEVTDRRLPNGKCTIEVR